MATLIKKIIRRIFNSDKAALARLRPDDRDLIQSVRANNLTYLSGAKLASIAETCRSIEDQGLPGMFIEAGCALGGSAILIGRIKSVDRLLNIYDVFGMIPSPTMEDGSDVHKRFTTIQSGRSRGIGGDRYYGYEKDLLDKVRDNLSAHGVTEQSDSLRLIKGLLQDTMSIREAVAFAHIDVDWYEPVKVCLERIVPNLVVGGSIIIDDYKDWSGCRKATDDFFARCEGNYSYDDSAGSLKITRTE